MIVFMRPFLARPFNVCTAFIASTGYPKRLASRREPAHAEIKGRRQGSSQRKAESTVDLTVILFVFFGINRKSVGLQS